MLKDARFQASAAKEGTFIAGYTVIADVGSTLIKLLRDQMTPEPVAQPELIGMASPADKGDLSLSLYLFNIKENGESRRTQMQPLGTGELQYPPLAINLHYLLTAHSAADMQSRTLDEHRMLGRALQLLHDHAVIRGPLLQGGLAESGEEIQIAVESIASDTLTGFWNFGDAPYKMSLVLRVGPVFLDSTRTRKASRVIEREIRLQDKDDN
ncbi:DUF4255 domain-containing protein [Paenibacillus sp. IB182496]|uniref:DUF4255 domain-containing protein n=1 Tax=Paenibacillus sabuli TaxID=2772509 RepID=A0A927BTN5_9BACL|nr:DUF4255 domain-containing protein [Paenibacillus sabuli]MBD2846097.1 DUF4255 domain-containing protein [Paenibacillus sabuli]